MKLSKLNNKKLRILISQVDNIGDVVITLPLVGILKDHFPNCEIFFLARSYTKAVVSAYKQIDSFIDWTELSSLPKKAMVQTFAQLNVDIIIHVRRKAVIAKLAKKAGIKIRIGKVDKFYNLIYYNKFIFYNRKRSKLHQSELYLKLLKPLGIRTKFSIADLVPYLKLTPQTQLKSELINLLDKNRFNLIIHPGSNGHSREWPIQHFKQLIDQLSEAHFKIFITGNSREQILFEEKLLAHCPQAINLMGKLTLDELLVFISMCDGIVSGSTGPMHLGAALDIHTLGLFPPKQGINPQRWQPIGTKAQYYMSRNSCEIDCFKQDECYCMQMLSVEQVKTIVVSWL